MAGRTKDADDIEILSPQLNIRTRKQAQHLVDRYIPDKRLQQLSDLEKTLHDFFPEP
jgi:hypothetical protein